MYLDANAPTQMAMSWFYADDLLRTQRSLFLKLSREDRASLFRLITHLMGRNLLEDPRLPLGEGSDWLTLELSAIRFALKQESEQIGEESETSMEQAIAERLSISLKRHWFRNAPQTSVQVQLSSFLLSHMLQVFDWQRLATELLQGDFTTLRSCMSYGALTKHVFEQVDWLAVATDYEEEV